MKTAIALTLAVVALAAGCATKPRIPLTGNMLIDGPAYIANGPAKDKVLWEYRTAAAEMRVGDYAQAKPLLDDAIQRLEGIYGPDKTAQRSRRLFSEEAKKMFVGEPYERVMAYYYRGILYWADGEPDNARACFRSAQIEDSSTEEHYASDYVLLDYLDGLASVKLSGDGADAFQRALKVARMNKPPAYDKSANVLFFIEFGPAVQKYGAGRYGEELHFRAAETPVKSAVVRVDKQAVRAVPYDDLGFQATTRGGRVMDHVLANKAVFKTTTDVAGDVALVGGLGTAVISHDRTAQTVGLGVAAAGVLLKVASALTTPDADIRTWDNLPRYLTFLALKVPPGQHVVTVEFHNGAGQFFPNLTKTITLDVPADGRDKVVFVSEMSTTPQTK
jgi:hypothetical protein